MVKLITLVQLAVGLALPVTGMAYFVQYRVKSKKKIKDYHSKVYQNLIILFIKKKLSLKNNGTLRVLNFLKAISQLWKGWENRYRLIK